MSERRSWRRRALGIALPLALGLAWPTDGRAQTGSGFASAAQGTALGMATTLAHTGSLVDDNDSRAVAMLQGSVPFLLQAQNIETDTISSGGANNANNKNVVASGAYLANMTVMLAGHGIQAAFLRASALSLDVGSSLGASNVEGLSVNGAAIFVTGETNQTVELPGLTMVLNEVRKVASGVTVNAMRLTTPDGTTDLAIGTAAAGLAR